MKVVELLEAMGLEAIFDFEAVDDREVVIEADRQLLPNYEYDFEVDADANRIVLRPTSRQ